jgi:hypothetical protein
MKTRIIINNISLTFLGILALASLFAALEKYKLTHETTGDVFYILSVFAWIAYAWSRKEYEA